MWLLNCFSKKLEEFAGADVPAYAILSHTWSDNEVVFSDITMGKPKDYEGKEGWSKISRSCNQALLDGYRYLWADTVCIDKSSSVELSEAINSMFKWYKQAHCCYAYLYDLSDAKGTAEKLDKCRWFTRGWTLQEMLAAQNLRFYDRNWVFQGSKASLIERISNITGVDTRALRGGNLRFFSVARKMSWASNRETTREEDMAYCLVSMRPATIHVSNR